VLKNEKLRNVLKFEGLSTKALYKKKPQRIKGGPKQSIKH